MQFYRSRGFIARFWALCIICAVFAGICFDNIQADSCFAYQNTGDAAFTLDAFGSSCDGKAVYSSLRGERRGIPVGQAYIPEISLQNAYVFMPRKTAQRTIFRGLFGSTFFLLPGRIFISAFFSRQITLFSDGLCEVISNTVILRYIHGQDGAKA